jgi:signal transduction histidine kinase
MTKSIEKEHEEQNRIISAISHDIKTPLTSIIGYSDLLINKKLKKDEMKALQEKIYNKALNIKEITSDFDDYLTSNSNRTYNYQEVNIKDLLNNLRIEYQDDLKDKSIKLEIVNKASQSTVTIDIGKMHRVFSNIITNSIRHIKNTKGLIRLEITDDNEFFKIKCIDNGVGVPE